jgi:armadillo repeat-containing protein 6
MKILKTQTDKDIICNSLKWIQKSCFFHEKNRQMIMNEEEFVECLKRLLNERSDERVIVKNIDACFRYLILDDDIRVEFGKGRKYEICVGCMSHNFNSI